MHVQLEAELLIIPRRRRHPLQRFGCTVQAIGETLRLRHRLGSSTSGRPAPTSRHSRTIFRIECAHASCAIERLRVMSAMAVRSDRIPSSLASRARSRRDMGTINFHQETLSSDIAEACTQRYLLATPHGLTSHSCSWSQKPKPVRSAPSSSRILFANRQQHAHHLPRRVGQHARGVRLSGEQ